MGVKLSLLAAVICLGMSVATSAVSQTAHLCELKDKGDRAGFISSPVVFILDDDQKSGLFLDGLTLQVLEGPAKAKVSRNARGRIRMTWNLHNVPLLSKSSANMSFHSLYDPEKSTFRMRGRLQGYVNEISATGTCRQLTEAELRKNKWFKERHVN